MDLTGALGVPGTTVAEANAMANSKMPLASASEIQLLHREIEAQGEWLNRERLERQTEVDRLKMELEAIRRVLSSGDPEFQRKYHEEFEAVRTGFNPEGP